MTIYLTKSILNVNKDHHNKNLKMNKTNKQISVNKKGAKNKISLFTCDICKQSFSYKYNLINHLKTHDSGRKIRQKSYQCKICDIEYCENRVLMNHIRNTHYNFEGKVSFYRDKMVNETWVERVKHTNVCVEMTKITHNVIAIKKCSQMNIQTVESNDTIKEWIVSVDDSISGYSKVVCDYCNKKMLRKSLPSHIRERHLNIKPFNCKTCGHNFNRKYQLSKHACGKYRQKPRRN